MFWLRSYDRHAVAHLQSQSGMRHQIESRTIDPGDVHPVGTLDMQFPEQTSVEFTAGNHDTPRDQLFVQFLPIGAVHFFYPRTDERRDGIHVLPRRDDQQTVSLAQRRIRTAYLHRTVGMQHPRSDEFLAYQMRNLPDRLAEDRGIVHLHRDMGGTRHLLGCTILRRFGFLAVIDPEHCPQQHIHQDDPDHTQRIRHRISHCNGRIIPAHILHRLLSRTQTGSIGYRTRKDTYHRGDRRPGGPKDTQVVSTPNATIRMANMFRRSPPRLNAEKKPGPTCIPME